jgi:hypothetical protein
MSQTEQIHSHLIKYGKIDPMTALKSYNCMRLSARISDLKEDGVKISTEMKYDSGKRWAVYHLDQNQEALSIDIDDRFTHDRPLLGTDVAPTMPVVNEEIKATEKYVISTPLLIGKGWAVRHLDQNQDPTMPVVNEEIKATEKYVIGTPLLIKRLIMAGVQIPSTVEYYTYSRGQDVPYEYWGSQAMVDDITILLQMLNSISPDGCSFGWDDDGRLGWWPIV